MTIESSAYEQELKTRKHPPLWHFLTSLKGQFDNVKYGEVMLEEDEEARAQEWMKVESRELSALEEETS